MCLDIYLQRKKYMSFERGENINILEVAKSLGFTPVHVCNEIYQDKEHDSLRFWSNTNSFCWYSQSGRNSSGSSFNLVMLVQGGNFYQAKQYLINKGLYKPYEDKNINQISFLSKQVSIESLSKEKQEKNIVKNKKNIDKLKVPPFNKNLKPLFSYLENRGIEEKTIWSLIKKKLIFLDLLENICFIAKDKNDKWQNITKRRIDTKNFYACRGGNKNYPFFIKTKSKNLMVVEGEIDAISCYQMYGNRCSYLSIPATTDKGLIHHIIENNLKQISVFLLMDNDETGLKANEKIKKDLENLNRNLEIVILSESVLKGVKDPNELLIRTKQIGENK